MEPAWVALGLLVSVPMAVLHVHALYSVLLLIAAIPSRRRPLGDMPASAELPRIVGLVVAHDEQRVIGRVVTSLVEQDYPKDRFSVWVVADNCTDQTKEVAERAGARVLERRTGAARGKAEAIRFGLAELVNDDPFEAVALFDADNVVDRRFLQQVGRRLSQGERVVQGFVDSKNPSSSWVAASSALGFWAIAAVQQTPRERVGLSVPPMGTALAIERSVAEEQWPKLSTLTDDLELHCRLVLDSTRVAFEPGARVYDEKPTRMDVAVRQRHRWMQGRWAVAGRFIPELLRFALGRKKSGSTVAARLRALDVAGQVLSPSLLFSSAALAVLALLSLLVEPLAGSGGWAWRLVPRVASLELAAFYFVVPAIAMAPYRPPPFAWLCYAAQPIYLLLSVPLALTGFLMRHGRSWKRTPHEG